MMASFCSNWCKHLASTCWHQLVKRPMRHLPAQTDCMPKSTVQFLLFLLVMIATLATIERAVAQSEIDLDSLFAEAESTPNPLAEEDFCEAENLLSGTLSASSADLVFEFTAFCEVDSVPDVDLEADRLFLLQGRATSLANSGRTAPQAYRALELVLDGAPRNGAQAAEDRLAPKFSGAIGPGQTVPFATAL